MPGSCTTNKTWLHETETQQQKVSCSPRRRCRSVQIRSWDWGMNTYIHHETDRPRTDDVRRSRERRRYDVTEPRDRQDRRRHGAWRWGQMTIQWLMCFSMIMVLERCGCFACLLNCKFIGERIIIKAWLGDVNFLLMNGQECLTTEYHNLPKACLITFFQLYYFKHLTTDLKACGVLERGEGKEQSSRPDAARAWMWGEKFTRAAVRLLAGYVMSRGLISTPTSISETESDRTMR